MDTTACTQLALSLRPSSSSLLLLLPSTLCCIGICHSVNCWFGHLLLLFYIPRRLTKHSRESSGAKKKRRDVYSRRVLSPRETERILSLHIMRGNARARYTSLHILLYWKQDEGKVRRKEGSLVHIVHCLKYDIGHCLFIVVTLSHFVPGGTCLWAVRDKTTCGCCYTLPWW